MAPPLISVGSQFSGRILRAHWVARVEVPGLSVMRPTLEDIYLEMIADPEKAA